MGCQLSHINVIGIIIIINYHCHSCNHRQFPCQRSLVAFGKQFSSNHTFECSFHYSAACASVRWSAGDREALRCQSYQDPPGCYCLAPIRYSHHQSKNRLHDLVGSMSSSLFLLSYGLSRLCSFVNQIVYHPNFERYRTPIACAPFVFVCFDVSFTDMIRWCSATVSIALRECWGPFHPPEHCKWVVQYLQTFDAWDPFSYFRLLFSLSAPLFSLSLTIHSFLPLFQTLKVC